ncbi:MAG: type IX secretion system outer membrane channel protein PorV [Chitinophagaceae bacterium]
MKSNKTFKLIASLLLVSGSTALKAQTADKINVVTTAVPFLRISPDARGGGMGETGIATSPDVNSAFWNLAKTSFNESRGGIGLTYTPWLRKLQLNDVYLATLAGYYKLSDNEAITASMRYFSLGNIQFTDNSGQDLGQFRPREFSFDAGYTRKLSDKIGLGVAGRYIHSNLASGAASTSGTTYKAGNAFAADLSLYYHGLNQNGEGWNLGVTLTNLGSKIGYTNDATQKDFIPANLGLGAAHTWVFDESNKFTLALDVNKLLVPTPPVQTGDYSTDSASQASYRSKSSINGWFSSFSAPGGFSETLKEFQISGGMEYTYMEQFHLRAGYFYEDKLKGNRKYFTLGAGLKYNVFGLNVSYIIPSGSGINQNPLSSTLRFSLIFDLDSETNGSNGGDNNNQ